MIISKEIKKLLKCIEIDANYSYKGKISIVNGYIAFDGSLAGIKDILKGTWIEEYLIDDGVINSQTFPFSQTAVFKYSILNSEPIVNFDSYIKSKQGIKKFNL